MTTYYVHEQRADVSQPEITSGFVSKNMLLNAVVVIVIDRTLQLNSEMLSLCCLPSVIPVSVAKRSTKLSYLIGGLITLSFRGHDVRSRRFARKRCVLHKIYSAHTLLS